MKHEVYVCDLCEAILSDELGKIFRTHLSINFGHKTGFAFRELHGEWGMRAIRPGTKQFCSPDCLKEFFTKFLKENPIHG